MSDLSNNPRDYFFGIKDISDSDDDPEIIEALGGFVVYLVEKRIWKARGNTDGQGLNNGLLDKIIKKTGWRVGERVEGVLEICWGKQVGIYPNSGGFPKMKFWPIPVEDVITGLKELGMTRSPEVEEWAKQWDD